MNRTKRAYFDTHVAVILFGFTAILGKLISLTAFQLVWWRVLITAFSLLLFNEIRKAIQLLDRKTILKFIAIGILVGLHWISFFGSVKYANASIALVCYASIAFFTAVLNPIMLKTKLSKLDLLMGVLVIFGMALVANTIDFSMMKGFWLGILSALLLSLFTILNKKNINQADPLLITFLEMLGAFLFLSLCIPIYYKSFGLSVAIPAVNDIVYLLILSLLCTTLAYVLSLRALKYIGTFESNLIYNLEPIYGIILAIFILDEHQELNTNFYLGVLLILSLVFLHPFLSKKYNW